MFLSNALSTHFVDFGTLAIGIGTLVLAIVLGIANWRNAKLDRKVHIADKRQAWIWELGNSLDLYVSVVKIVEDKRSEVNAEVS